MNVCQRSAVVFGERPSICQRTSWLLERSLKAGYRGGPYRPWLTIRQKRAYQAAFPPVVFSFSLCSEISFTQDNMLCPIYLRKYSS